MVLPLGFCCRSGENAAVTQPPAPLAGLREHPLALDSSAHDLPATSHSRQGEWRTHSVDVRITFGIIVLNGEPFIRYNLRSLYPWAHQIVVVEGACRTAKAVATPDGHSIDGTLETIRRFQAEEDPERQGTPGHRPGRRLRGRLLA